MATEREDIDFRAGERRTATILFSDMKGFTALSERMDPEDMDSLMNTVFAAFEEIIRRHDGTVEKYIGDALVAVFGAQRIHEDDPVRAINAGLDFISEIGRLNRGLAGRNLTLSFRTGIHTGLIATGKRGKFDVVTGHAMSVASRLESAASPNSVFVSSNTFERCRNEFLFTEPVELDLKGKRETVTAYRVRGRNTHPLAESEPFVGREQQLSEMIRKYIKHDPATTSGYMLVGDAGMGKTALAVRFISQIRALPDFSSPVMYARAQRYRNLPFAVVTDLITNYLGINGTPDEEDISSRLVDTIGTEPKSAHAFSALLRGTEEGTRDTQFFVHLYGILQAILSTNEKSAYAPVIFIDNAEHMDAQSSDFFQYFMRNASEKPFFLLTDRAEHPALANLFTGIRTLRLTPLAKDAARTLVDELLPGTADEETRRTILENAAGNPLFLQEYSRYARDTRDLGAIPSTIQAIFLSTTESFEAPVRDLLKKLSVFAHSFSVEDAMYIQERTDGDPKTVPSVIDQLIQQGILVEENRIYLFKHDLFKKALYSSLLNYNKRIVHRLIAQRMREVGRPHTLRLIYHLSRAEEFADARSVLASAPDRTVNMEYLPYIDMFLTHVKEDDFDTRIQYLYMESAILFNNGNTENADVILKQILRIAVQQENIQFMADAYHLLTAYNMKSYSFQKAYFCGRKALSYYGRMGNRQFSEASVIKIMSLTELLRNNLDESAQLVHRLSEDRFSHCMDAVEARAERYLLIGDYRDAADLLEFSIERLGESVDDHWFSIYSLLSVAYWQLCDFDRVKSTARKLLSAGGRHYSNISQLHAHLAVACRYTGEDDLVAENIQQAEFYAYQIRNDFDLIDALRSLAVALLILGDEQKSLSVANEGLTIGLRHSAFYPTFSLLMVLAEIHFTRGEIESCRYFLDEASFSVELNPLLPPRDIIMYYYLKYLLEPNGMRADYLETAYGLLEHEKAELDDVNLVKVFLNLRSFGKIESEIAAARKT